MKLIDKYILKKFLATFFYVTMILNAVICVIDYGEKSEDFIKHKLTAWEVVSLYYVNFVPSMTNMLSPIIIFIAAVFVTSRLSARTEIIAILSSGVSFLRFLAPFMVGATLLGLLGFASTGWIVPYANKGKVAFELAYIKDQFFYDGRNVHFKVAPNTFAYLQSYNNITQTGYYFTLEYMEGSNMTAKLSADQIAWDSLKQTWRIAEYRLHTFNGDKEKLRRGANLDTAINLRPKDFQSTHLLHETFTLPQLDDYIAEQQTRGNTNVGIFLVERYERFAYPFAMLILTFMGVTVAARKSRQGTGLQIAVGFLLAFVFVTLVRMCRSFGQAGTMEPLTAAWTPTILFALIAVVMYKTIPK